MAHRFIAGNRIINTQSNDWNGMRGKVVDAYDGIVAIVYDTTPPGFQPGEYWSMSKCIILDEDFNWRNQELLSRKKRA